MHHEGSHRVSPVQTPAPSPPYYAQFCKNPSPSPPGVATTTVFKPGEEGYKAFRIPGMLAFKDVLMVFAEGRKVSE